MKKTMKRLLVIILFVPYCIMALAFILIIESINFILKGNDKFADKVGDYLLSTVKDEVIEWSNK